MLQVCATKKLKKLAQKHVRLTNMATLGVGSSGKGHGLGGMLPPGIRFELLGANNF